VLALWVLHRYGYAGLNVTAPLKSRAAVVCESLDDRSLALGAVNTLTRTGQGWAGSNTDVEGAALALASMPRPRGAAIVGNGGAARAVRLAACEAGIPCEVFARTPAPGETPLSALGERLESGSLDLVVNATTLGWSDDDVFPVPAGLPGVESFLDLNYNPGWSWRNAIGRSGCRVYTGELMLAGQAAASFRIWTGFPPDPHSALRTALDGAGERR